MVIFYYAGAGQREDTRRLIDEALARNPNDLGAAAGRALVFAWEGRDAEARALLPDPPPGARREQTYITARTFAPACARSAATQMALSVGCGKRSIPV